MGVNDIIIKEMTTKITPFPGDTLRRLCSRIEKRDNRHQVADQKARNCLPYPASTQTFAGTVFNFAAWAVAHVPDDANRAWNERIGP